MFNSKSILNRMNSKTVLFSILYLIIGVFLLSILVSGFLFILTPKQQPATIVYEVSRPNYGWSYPYFGWSHGPGLPGMKPPKPAPAQPAPAQPAPPPPPAPPAQPPPPPPAQP